MFLPTPSVLFVIKFQKRTMITPAPYFNDTEHADLDAYRKAIRKEHCLKYGSYGTGNVDLFCESIAEARTQIEKFANEMIKYFTVRNSPFDEASVNAHFKSMRVDMDNSISIAKIDRHLYKSRLSHACNDDMYITLLKDLNAKMMRTYGKIGSSFCGKVHFQKFDDIVNPLHGFIEDIMSKHWA